MLPYVMSLMLLFAVVALLIDVRIIRRLVRELERAQAVAESLAERVQKQSDILSRRAEKSPDPWYDWRHRPPTTGPYNTPGFTADDLPTQVDGAALPSVWGPRGAVARLRAAEPRRENDP